MASADTYVSTDATVSVPPRMFDSGTKQALPSSIPVHALEEGYFLPMRDSDKDLIAMFAPRIDDHLTYQDTTDSPTTRDKRDDRIRAAVIKLRLLRACLSHLFEDERLVMQTLGTTRAKYSGTATASPTKEKSAWRRQINAISVNCRYWDYYGEVCHHYRASCGSVDTERVVVRAEIGRLLVDAEDCAAYRRYHAETSWTLAPGEDFDEWMRKAFGWHFIPLLPTLNESLDALELQRQEAMNVA